MFDNETDCLPDRNLLPESFVIRETESDEDTISLDDFLFLQESMSDDVFMAWQERIAEGESWNRG